jgi:single-stranded-DNA-specific exonuclease
MKWSKRLPTYRVIAANYGYTPGRVHFSVRTVRDENLIDALLEVGAPEDEEAEFAYGHGMATGGVVSFDGFGEFLSKLGFPHEVHQRLEAAAP